MAEHTWDQVLGDTTQFPDTMTMTMENGATVSLGALREQHQQQKRQTLALLNEKQALEQQQVNFIAQQQQWEQQQRQHQQGQQTQNGLPEMYQTDPLFRPLVNELSAAKSTIEQLQDWQKRMEAQYGVMNQTVQMIPVAMQVQKLQGQDASLDGAKLLDFAREKHIQPQFLEDAHKLMTRDRDIEAARLAGIEAGKAEAQAAYQAQVPQVPYTPYGIPQQQMPEQQFKSLDAAAEAALRDPEMYQEYTGQA